jgi:glucose-1-phosphate thymidylyltransferase
MTFDFLHGWWTDAGTFDSLLRAANLVAKSVTARRQAEAEKIDAEGAMR